MRPLFFFPLLTGLALLATLAALGAGTDGLHPLAALAALQGDDPLSRAVILDLRWPRVLTAFSCGALLALSGALLQALLRNPLADPFVLGISGGASTLGLLALMLGAGVWETGLASGAGALGSALLLFLLAGRGGLLPWRLLLAGVILSSAWGAAVTLLLALAPDAPLRSMVFWLMGDLSGGGVAPPALLLLAALGVAVAAWPLARGLDALGRGETSAGALGVPVLALRLTALLLATLATALVVTNAGSIGFVGLVTPHLLRLAGCRRHRWLLPAAALAGGTLLVGADTLARTVAAPLQLPVGAVTAALGAPLFLWLLARQQGRP